MMTAKKGLGKGLGALFGEETLSSQLPMEGSVMLPLRQIEPNPNQPRHTFDEGQLAELAESIRLHGVIQPLTVRKMDNGFYQIIAGERRWRASRMAELQEVPAVVIEADDKKATELALIENLQRADLNPIEEALGYQRLMQEFQMTQEITAERVGKSRPAVANALRLLSLSPKVLEMVEKGQISAGHARTLLALKTDYEQLAVAEKIYTQRLSVRQTESLCKKMVKTPRTQETNPLEVNYIAECEKDLARTLSRGVHIIDGKRKGRIELEYYGQDDLQRLYELLQALGRKEQNE